MTRYVVKDFTFSDGTTIPAGNMISVPLLAIHLDPVRGPLGLFYTRFRTKILRRFTAILEVLMGSDLRKCGEKAAKMPSTNSHHLLSIILYLDTVVKHGV